MVLWFLVFFIKRRRKLGFWKFIGGRSRRVIYSSVVGLIIWFMENEDRVFEN